MHLASSCSAVHLVNLGACCWLAAGCWLVIDAGCWLLVVVLAVIPYCSKYLPRRCLDTISPFSQGQFGARGISQHISSINQPYLTNHSTFTGSGSWHTAQRPRSFYRLGMRWSARLAPNAHAFLRPSGAESSFRLRLRAPALGALIFLASGGAGTRGTLVGGCLIRVGRRVWHNELRTA